MEEINYLLLIAGLLDGKINGIWKYVSRILISYFVKKELIDELDFEISIQKAAEEGFVDIIDNSVVLTPVGKQYLETIQTKLKFSDEICLQILKLKSFSDDEKRKDYIKHLEEELKDILEYVESRKVEISENILTNAFVGKVEGNVFMLTLTSKEYVTKRDFSGKDMIKKDIEKLCREEGITAYYHLGYDKITMICNKLSENFLNKIKSLGFRIVDVEEKEFFGLENCAYFLSKIISDYLQKKKLVKISNTMKFIDFSEEEEIDVSINGLKTKMKLYHGFNLKLEILPHHKKFLVWIDPTYVQFFTLDKWIEFNDVDDNEEILEKFANEDILVLPRRRSCRVTDIDIDREIGEELKNYWLEKYGLKLRNNKGIAKIRFEWQKEPLEYPLETVTFSKEWIEKNVGIIEKNDPTLSPMQRLHKIKEYFKKYFQDIRTDIIEIIIEEELLSVEKLKKFVKDCYRLLPPKLVFSKENPFKYKSNDTRAIFKFGPYSKDKKIFISKIICPDNITIKEIEEFLTKIKRTYDTFFGELEFDIEEIRLPYSRKLIHKFYDTFDVYSKLKEKLKSKTPLKKEDYTPIVIVVNPDKKSILHYYLKALVIDCWEVRDQHIKENTFYKIKEGHPSLARSFCLQLYLKSLNYTEVPWILEFPSDKKSETIYCGIGYSMRIDLNNTKKSIGVFSICDAQGKYIFQKNILLPNTSYYLSEDLLDKVFKFLMEKTEHINFKRVVIYKKGKLTNKERKIVMDFIDNLRKNEFWKEKKIDIISVEDSIIRLFKIVNDSVLNVDHGVTLVLNNKESIICTSGHPDIGIKQGTTKILKINFEIADSDKNIEDITQEYYDRTFLNWMAPITLSKYPPELRIANNIAEIMKEVEIKREFPYMVV